MILKEMGLSQVAIGGAEEKRYLKSIKINAQNVGLKKNLTVHHKIQLSLGGDNSLNNLILLCKDCHEAVHKSAFMDKGDFDTDEDYGKGYKVNKKVKQISKAINNNENIEITYTRRDGVTTKREVTPGRLFKEYRRTYLRAFCHLRGEKRTFRVSRILSIREIN